MIPTVMSCSNESQEINANDLSYFEISKKYEGILITMKESFNKISKESEFLNMYRSYNGVELTQELIDEYSVMIGYEPGYISLELVEEVMDKNADIIEYGYVQVLEDLNLSSFTKLKVSEIIDGGWVEDLQNSTNYNSLDLNEKEILAMINTYAKEISMLPSNEQGRFWDGFTSFAIGAIVGAFTLGIGGFIVGGFIGMFVNGLVKD